MNMLLPDRLKALWQSVTQGQLTAEAYTDEQERLLAEYRKIWADALRLERLQELQESLLSELAWYVGCQDLAEIQRRCKHAVGDVKREWQDKVQRPERQFVEQFYNESHAMLYELMWWHTLADDSSPLAYVLALDFARQRQCQRYLDFGAGVGSGGILFANHGLQTTLADISSSLLHFSRWRFDKRGLQTQCLDLKACSLPSQAFDFVTAMDVFEHLSDPVEAVEHLWQALKPGGFLFARISVQHDEDRPQHIVSDFGPTLARLQGLGMVEVWRDEWLWGHQVFQKSSG